MQISYELTEKDFVEAYRAHRKRSTFRKWTLRIVIAIIVITAVTVFGEALVNPSERDPAALFLYGGLVIFWIAAIWALPQWSMRRQFRKQPAAHGPRTATFDADGAHWRWDGGSSDVAWKNYIRWAEGPNQVLFYTSPACFGILSTRTLQPAQVAELREILKQNIQSKK